MFPFSPSGGTVSLSASASSSRVELPTGDPCAVRVENAGAVTVYVRFGDSAVTASASDGMGVLPGTIETFRVPVAATHLAGITATGAATLRLTPGAGL